VQDWKFQDII
jgi:hypothetical protein